METMRLTAELVTRPTSEPITLSEAKKQLEIADSDDNHDDHLRRCIYSAREQWEHDTDSACCFQTWKVVTDSLYDGMTLPKRPVSSITSITYYDSANVLRTLSSTVYQIDKGKRQLRLAYLQEWPITVSRWDAFTINFKIGYSQDGQLVPSVAKQAMLLLIGYYFDANRGENDKPNDMRAYEALVMRFLRSSYP